MFPKSKRFRSPVSHAPPVGSYDVKGKANNAASIAFGKSKRFGQSKENLPGPCDTSAFLGDISTCSGSSFSSNLRSTPKPKSNNRVKISDLERTIENVKEELNYLREQNLQLTSDHLQKQEKCMVSQEKQTQTESFGGANDFENIRKELENLKITQKCELEKSKADFDLEITRNLAFKSRIEALEIRNKELFNEREQIEDDNRRLQATRDDLTRENLELSEKLNKKGEDLQDREEQLKLALNDKEKQLESMEKEKFEFVNKCEQLEADIQMTAEKLTISEKKFQANCDTLQNENSQLIEKLYEFEITKEQLNTKVEELNITIKQNLEFDQKCKLLEKEIQGLKEEIQQLLSTAEQEAANQKREFDSMKIKYTEVIEKLEIKNKDVDMMNKELVLNKEKAGKTIENLMDLLDKELVKTKAYEERNIVCNENMKNALKTVDSLHHQKNELEKEAENLKETIAALEKQNQNISIIHKEEKEKSDALMKRLQTEKVELNNKLDLEIVKTKAHEDKYAKSLKHYEQNIANTTKTAEDLSAKNKELNKKVCDLEKLVEELRSREHDIESMSKKDEGTIKWKSKYEELLQKIEPFKEQLDNFEAEKNFLLSKHSEAQNEVSKLSEQYAKLLGHQNQKQKIHHILKLKQENIDLKSELTKMRELCDKQKRNMKLQENVSTAKKKFNPAEAFSHVKKSEQ